ncbi:cobalamin B12-binding domain-containing protein [Ovoidimarina sediminis]|uniref:cobalamin B12-binding domain-containing protein n=1 Tax=Ovoidimarina sediminis TaxID=3079856 RepID=UPI002906BEDE|nr:cobalamin-dependent protein [Rhodophyticola sp. MJ-SS7]MDU8944504.1 cobalamin-dependent protein [Rhodophyticola sp. MJ-SS7]
MTDGPDRPGRRSEVPVASPVDTLASRAVAVLAERRERTRAPLSERLLARLSDAVLKGGNGPVEAAVADILHSGCPAEEVLGFYIPEVARRLGDDWCEDRLGFAQVSIGSARLQHAVRALSAGPRKSASDGPGHAVLVVVPEGEHHTLGAVVLTAQLRQRGLSVRLVMGEANRMVVRTVASGQYDAIFLSISSAERLAQLRVLIEKSKNALPVAIPTVVGGALGAGGKDIAKLAGADHAASDLNEALRRCGLTISPNGATERAKME